jgi:hypothetical protein
MTIFLALAALWQALLFSPQLFPFPGNPPAGGGATFTIIQSVTLTASSQVSGNRLTCSVTTCTLTVPAMGSGNKVLLLMTEASGNNLSMTSVTGGGSWVVPGSILGFNACCGVSTGAYNLNTTGGTTAVVTNWTSNPATTGLTTAFYWELSGGSAFDAANNVFNNALSTSQTGAAVTLSGSSDAIGQNCVTSAGSVNSAASPYNTNFTNTDNGSQGGSISFQGASIALNIASGSGAVFTTSSATSVCSTLALK